MVHFFEIGTRKNYAGRKKSKQLIKNQGAPGAGKFWPKKIGTISLKKSPEIFGTISRGGKNCDRGTPPKIAENCGKLRKKLRKIAENFDKFPRLRKI